MYTQRASRIPGAVVWHVDGSHGAPGSVLPDGCMDLLWCDGTISVAGPDTYAYVPDATMRRPMTGLRFAPGFAPAVLGVPAHELRDRRVRLDEIWTPRTMRRHRATATEPGRWLEQLTVSRLRDRDDPDPLMTEVATLLRHGNPVAMVASRVHLSARQLQRRSLTAFGYGPKTLERILRMNRALDLVRGGEPAVSAAITAGYADQAHFARETKRLTGASVTTLTA